MRGVNMGQLLGIEIGNSNIKFVLGTKKGGLFMSKTME